MKNKDSTAVFGSGWELTDFKCSELRGRTLHGAVELKQGPSIEGFSWSATLESDNVTWTVKGPGAKSASGGRALNPNMFPFRVDSNFNKGLIGLIKERCGDALEKLGGIGALAFSPPHPVIENKPPPKPLVEQPPPPEPEAKDEKEEGEPDDAYRSIVEPRKVVRAPISPPSSPITPKPQPPQPENSGPQNPQIPKKENTETESKNMGRKFSPRVEKVIALLSAEYNNPSRSELQNTNERRYSQARKELIYILKLLKEPKLVCLEAAGYAIKTSASYYIAINAISSQIKQDAKLKKRIDSIYSAVNTTGEMPESLIRESKGTRKTEATTVEPRELPAPGNDAGLREIAEMLGQTILSPMALFQSENPGTLVVQVKKAILYVLWEDREKRPEELAQEFQIGIEQVTVAIGEVTISLKARGDLGEEVRRIRRMLKNQN